MSETIPNKELETKIKEYQEYQDNSYLGFGWWNVYTYLLIIGLFILGFSNKINSELQQAIIIINVISIIFMLRYNKYAFLISTLFSFNPLIWLINGIYLRNRWNHPKVNSKDNNRLNLFKFEDLSNSK